MLEVKNITKYYGEHLAVDDVSFAVKPGEIFGLLGVNGAGKTSTFRMIIGLLEPNQGSITFNGKKIDYSLTDEIGFLTEERSLLTKLTVKEQAIYYGTLKGMEKAKINSELERLLERFNISDYKDRKIKELSKGNQQKIQFIMAIINSPKLLILDEPFSGLDPVNVEMFKEVIKELQKKGTAIIFSSHRMDHVELFCEKLMILVEGKSVIEGYLKKIKEDFRRKTIFISGNVKSDELEKIDGVIKVSQHINEYEVSVSEQEKVENVFNYVKKCNNVTKFIVAEPSLNEIFIARVGVTYGK